VIRFRALSTSCLLAALPLVLSADDTLTPDKLALLHDAGGWEYISMNDSQNGFPTEHTCFDGEPHPDTCSGTLVLTADNNFVQKTVIGHQSVSRRGTYELDGDQLAFFDEFGTRDGPYTIAVDIENKLMSMDMPQVKVKLELYKEYRKKLDAKQKKKNSSR
jgi:hypothetical protein